MSPCHHVKQKKTKLWEFGDMITCHHGDMSPNSHNFVFFCFLLFNMVTLKN